MTIDSEGIVTKRSPRSVGETVSRLTRLIEDRSLTLFAVIDHSGAAKGVGMEMPDTKLVIFGSPAAGTPVMLASPLAALDLPLKVLVRADPDGNVSISYNSPSYLATRYHLTDDLRSHIEPIESITDATVAASP
ncbi:MAG: putative exported protein [Actinomycetia bacterium]|nr:putative exported protein [Actinomycetes bacterium]